MTRTVLAAIVVGLSATAASAAGELDLSLATVGGAAAIAQAEPTAQRFASGSFSFQTYGSAAVGSDRGEVYALHVGAGWYFVDHLSINLEAVGALFDIDDHLGHDGGDAQGAGLDLLFRWHFYNQDRLSLYLDGGAGIIYSGESFPASGTNFNFTPQAGVGLTYQLTDEVHLMGGARWYHISNARKDGVDENPGYDAAMLYLGVMVPF